MVLPATADGGSRVVGSRADATPFVPRFSPLPPSAPYFVFSPERNCQ